MTREELAGALGETVNICLNAAQAVATDPAAVPEPLIEGADALDDTVAREEFIELGGARQSQDAADEVVDALSTLADILLFDAIGSDLPTRSVEQLIDLVKHSQCDLETARTVFLEGPRLAGALEQLVDDDQCDATEVGERLTEVFDLTGAVNACFEQLEHAISRAARSLWSAESDVTSGWPWLTDAC